MNPAKPFSDQVEHRDDAPRSAQEWNRLLVDHLVANPEILLRIRSEEATTVAKKLQAAMSEDAPLRHNWLVQFVQKKADDVTEKLLDRDERKDLQSQKKAIDVICEAFDESLSTCDMLSKSDARQFVLDALSAGFSIGAIHAKEIDALREFREEKRRANRASIDSRNKAASEGWKLHAAVLMRDIHLANPALSNRRLFQIVEAKWSFKGRPCPSSPTLQQLLNTLDDVDLVSRKRRDTKNR